MTVLAANITDSQTLIPVDAGLTNGSFQLPLYYTVDSEAIRVTGRAHRTTWLVERGIAGTTAASHSSAATLTRYYPEAATGEAGAGGVTVDNTVDPPFPASTLIAPSAFESAPDEATIQKKDFYAQDIDPGAVGVGSVWKNTSDGNYWERNITDDGWYAIFQPIVTADGDSDANVQPSATAPGNGNAVAGSAAISEGTGYADAQAIATATGDGDAFASPTATTTGLGGADAHPYASASGSGTATAGPVAISSGSGDAGVAAVATATTGTAYAGSLAARGAAVAGMSAEVDGTSARMAFNGTTPIAKPTGVAVTAEAIHAALVSLGLIAA